MDWKSIWEKVLAGVIGAAILGVSSWFWGSWSSPEVPTIVSFYSALDIPNPIYLERDAKKLADFDTSVRVAGLASYLSRADSQVRIGNLRIKNNSRIRSKAIEVTVTSGGMFKTDAKISGQEFQKQISIPTLDGLKEANLLVLTNKQYSNSPPVQLIYDDRTIDVSRLPDFENAVLFAGGMPVALIFAGIGLIAAIFMIAGIIYAVAVRVNPDLEIKNLTGVQVAKMLKQIDRIKEKYPEKIPKEESVPPLRLPTSA